MPNCIKFAYDLWRLRGAAYEGVEDGRYVCMRKPDWGNFPCVLCALWPDGRGRENTGCVVQPDVAEEGTIPAAFV
jgi:hypothetical protein